MLSYTSGGSVKWNSFGEEQFDNLAQKFKSVYAVTQIVTIHLDI